VQADYVVELGRNDPVLELPWAAPDGGPRHYDLKRHPELLAEIEEAVRVPELGEFLAAINAPASRLESAKCDAWFSSEMDPDEDIFAAAGKFGSYVDLVLLGDERFSFVAYEKLAKRLTELLRGVPEIPAQAEFMVRRAFFKDGQDVRKGFYVTSYLFGYGPDEAHARKQWGIALKLVQNAIGQVLQSSFG
jgi:hypothetical protein